MALKFGLPLLALIATSTMCWSGDATPPEDYPSYLATEKHFAFCEKIKAQGECEKAYATTDATPTGDAHKNPKVIKMAVASPFPPQPWLVICDWNNSAGKCEAKCDSVNPDSYTPNDPKLSKKEKSKKEIEILTNIEGKVADACSAITAKKGGKSVSKCTFSAKMKKCITK